MKKKQRWAYSSRKDKLGGKLDEYGFIKRRKRIKGKNESLGIDSRIKSAGSA